MSPEPATPDGRLHYADDSVPGYTRRRRPNGFTYYDTRGKPIRDAATLARIRALAIPPAYESVWICPSANGHLQATGRDARGRKQYRYHPEWRALCEADKYGQLLAFGESLPRIRRRVACDMRRPALSREKVLSVVVRLLEATLIRVGTREYARSNGSYGLTTLLRRHARVDGQRLRLRFRGKSSVPHDVTITDRTVARTVRRCLEIPGQQLFQYLDADGQPHDVDSEMVNAYLKEASGSDFTAKHYRTWAGSVHALAELRRPEYARPSASHVTAAVRRVAERLYNTPAVCRKCYIHPAVIDAYLAGALAPGGSAPAGPAGLKADERRLLDLLRRAKG